MFIVQTYLIESSLQGICGTVLGLFLGSVVAIGTLLKSYGHYVFVSFPILSVAESLLISFICGSLISVLAAIAPAYIAAKKQPVDALRVEE